MALSKLEELEATYEQYATIIEFRGLKRDTGLYGAYKNIKGKPYIILEPDQPEIDKQVILREEFMHFLTSVGVIVDQKQLNNRKQELLARRLAYKSAISIDDLIKCYNLGLQTNYEIAAELELPEDFVLNAINYFKTQMSNGTVYKGYRVNLSNTITFTKVRSKERIAIN